MSKKQSKNPIQIIQSIQAAAIKYKEQLIGRTFLYIFEEQWIEVIYTKKGFKHLTGVESKLSAKSFFEDAINHRLSIYDIFFSPRHPYNLAIRKINHLEELPGLAAGESFFLQNISTNTNLFKFGATNLSFTLLFNQSIANENIASNCYHVESLRDEDCFAKSANVYEVTHILSKRNDQKLYNTVHFIDKRYNLRDIPDSIKPMIDMESIPN